LYALTKNRKDPKAKVRFIKYCKILRKFIKEAKKQNCSRLTVKSNNKIKTTWNIIKKEIGKIRSVEQVPTLLVNNEKLKYPTEVAKAFNNFL
jgi:hypothetical protein